MSERTQRLRRDKTEAERKLWRDLRELKLVYVIIKVAILALAVYLARSYGYIQAARP